MGDNLQEHYYDSFISQEKHIRHGPVTRRTLTDTCCLLIFLLLFLAFVGIGVYYLTAANEALKGQLSRFIISVRPLTVIKQLIIKYWPVLVGAFGLSLLLSLAYLLLLRFCTKCMVYTIIVLGLLALGAVLAISIISGATGAIVTSAVTLGLYICMLCCLWGDIQRGILMLRATMGFLRDRCEVMLVPVLCLLLMLLFLGYWVLTLLCIQYQASLAEAESRSATKQIVFYAFWLFMLVFMAIFLYYVMVFMIGYTSAHWFYGKQERVCCRGFCVMVRYHIGSITFASLLLTLIQILKIVANSLYRDSATTGNCLTTCCTCLLSCCLQCIGYIIQTLNKYAIIVLSLTGQSYIPSARTAAGVLFRDFSLFYASDLIGSMVSYAGVVLSAGVPSLAAYLVVCLVYLKSFQVDSYEMTVFILLVFLVCVVIALFFVASISTALAAVFLFFCLDQRYREIGLTVPGVPIELRNLEQDPALRGSKQEPIVPYSAQRMR